MDTISFATSEGIWYSLKGEALLVGVAGVHWAPANGPGATVEEVLDLQLSGTPAENGAGLATLGQVVATARSEAGQPQGWWVYLWVKVTGSDPAKQAKILDGWVELLKGADYRTGGTQGVRLHLVRENHWTEAETEHDLLDGVYTVYNHADNEHFNYFTVFSGEVDAETPLRLRYALSGITSGPVTLYVGQLRARRGGVKTNYPGEELTARAGTTRTVVTDATSAGGQHGSFAWTAAGSWGMAGIFYASMSEAEADRLAGKAYKLLLRMPGGPAERMLARVLLFAVDGTSTERQLWESDPFYLEAGRELQEGPVLFLPPWQMSRAAVGSPPLRLAVQLGTSGSGAKTVKVDTLALLPLDGWRIYRPAVGLPNLDIDDDANRESLRTTQGTLSHYAEGPGFVVGYVEYSLLFFYLSIETAGGGNESPIAAEGQVRLHGRKRAGTL